MTNKTSPPENLSGAQVERVKIADGELVYRPITVCSGENAQQKIQATYTSQSVTLSLTLCPEEAANVVDVLAKILEITDLDTPGQHQ